MSLPDKTFKIIKTERISTRQIETVLVDGGFVPERI